jgi:hypothetical protein
MQWNSAEIPDNFVKNQRHATEDGNVARFMALAGCRRANHSQ